jgi:NAD(P)-dependent dehydrogenase (short-subunit alcohol dehydrogenase family)
MGSIVVTGANRGIGLELCKQLKARGADVIAVCRKSSSELDALGVRVEADIDVADAAAAGELAKRLAGVEIDTLINNAGILRGENLGAMDFESVAQQLEVNAIAPLRVTAALLPLLREGSKVVITTSRMGSMADNGSGGYYGYRMSKAAVNAAGVSLAHDLKSRGIAVALIHPGMVATEMTGRLARIDEVSLENTGRFWHATTGETLPW